MCGRERMSRVFRYDEPPEGETEFAQAGDAKYEREFWRCEVCGHFVSVHDLDVSGLYEGAYVDATYSDDGMRRSFERIMSLPEESSDNVQRVRRILDYFGPPGTPSTVLDVGSGLGVFPARMKEAGWRCTVVDPDERAVAHARERIGVEAVRGDYMALESLGRFDLVTFNKVLEHVEDPVAMLERSAAHLQEGGTVYVEVPDGEVAAREGPGREEFFIEHLCAFSMASLALLADHAGFAVRRAERLREPSTKYTLVAFLEHLGPA
jgi:SAM-dependent methyltransferase